MNKVHILHTNDIHSHFSQMPYISSCIHELKRDLEEKGETVLVLDLGDHTDRMSLLTEGTWGKTNIEVMNLTGYQFVTIGNNEGLTFPKEKLEKLYAHANFKVICSNFFHLDSKRAPDWMVPSHMVRIGDLSIGLLGVTAPYQSFYHLLGWDVLSPLEIIADQVRQLKNQADILILMSHLGFQRDLDIARRFPEIRLIIGSHTHHTLPEGIREGNCLIAQAGKFGEYVGHITIEQTEEGFHYSASLHEVSTMLPDPRILDFLRLSTEQVEEEMGERVAVLDEDLPVYWDKESPLGNVLAQGLRNYAQGEISMVNSGVLLEELPRGEISRKKLLQMCPHPINPCRLKLTGEQILTILEESLLQRNIQREIRGFGFRGKVLGWMCVDGLYIHYDPQRPEGEKVIQAEVNGEILQPNQMYTVATIDMFTFGAIFPAFTEAVEVEYLLPEFIRDVLLKELNRYQSLSRFREPRWISI
ncbi:bifunctional metallophosphatase/5'-nucleotidase [Microaerobacter geothermalis]|uniref:bifunctional metallophosphatase/5'-nucleotidase n=1 Tax=Microaerobacter geothermalis TaxID=674972 RepID=UPI001F46148C|nr:bifunctional UDP-sugar hydrolase/5'-nucleotidase [Microaerobacter geothermalis]